MEDLIKQITEGLSSAQSILSRIIQHEEVSMEEKISLFDFFKKHEQVSDLSAYIRANNISFDAILSLNTNCQSFLQFCNENESALASFNPREECKAYLAPYQQEVETEGKAWARLDTEKRHLSDRMDYLYEVFLLDGACLYNSSILRHSRYLDTRYSLTSASY